MYHYRIHSKGYNVSTIGTKRISCYLVLVEIEKDFLKKCNAQTVENNMLVEISFWTSLEKLLKGIINADLLIEKKLEIIHEIYTNARIRQHRKESYNLKVYTILSIYAAWYLVNMEVNIPDGFTSAVR